MIEQWAVGGLRPRVCTGATTAGRGDRQAPDPSTERKGLFIPVIQLCLRMWEGRALTSREEGSGVALWGKGQTKHLSRVSSPNLHFY